MAKQATKFICTSCGYESPKWYGRCPNCSNWNTFDEVSLTPVNGKKGKAAFSSDEKLLKLSDVKTTSRVRVSTRFEELDRVLGGGMIPGSVVLLSGDPGIGKSTLLLQVALHVSGVEKRNVLYISGEESGDQVRLRAERIIDPKTLDKHNLFILSSTNIDAITDLITKERPTLVIIDSIQTMQSETFSGFAGSLPQIRHATSSLVSVAKSQGIAMILVGHVTKEGIVAGPMLLSHMVDAVLYLEGDRLTGTRIVRAFKNRFGDTAEVGIFIMQERGMEQIQDASNFFLDKQSQNIPGSCASVILEGSRPIVIEVQALTVASTLPFPRRVVNGISDKRVELLLAVLQKHLCLPLDKLDVFVNIVGGLKIQEPSIDLAICLAVVSSFKNTPLSKTAAVAEVGLLGELRSVISLEKRASEARKFGYKRVLTFADFKNLSDIVKSVL